MISKKGKFIFIHNYKTGGTSIERKLGHFQSLERNVQDHRTIRDIELLTHRNHFFKKSLYAFKIGKPKKAFSNFKTSLYPELTKKEFDEFYKFAFVRNSWSRIYSWYINIMKNETDRIIYNINDDNYTFLQFLKEKINHSTFSQLYFISDKNGDIPMDFIGRFENLQNDFNVVCRELNIVETVLPKLLVRKYGHYTDNYTAETKDLIYQLYKDEIDYFGFEFGE